MSAHEVGAQVLDDLEAFARRFVAFPSEHDRVAYALWIAHAHVVDAFESTPRLALLSPEPGSGKTRALEILELLVPRPMFSVNQSATALFRQVSSDDGRPTMLIDEADTIFGPRASKDHEDLRAFVNAGHRRGATSVRCAFRGKEVIVEQFPAFCAVGLAGLDDLPATVMTRSVVIRMRRRAPDEHVQPFRRRLHGPAGFDLRDQLADWTGHVAADLADAWPEMPDGITDRPADVWEPLLALADAAGGAWPERARVAAVTHVTDARRGGAESFGVQLLRDLRVIFDDRDKVPTEQLLEGLNDLEESPWGNLRGKPLDARSLARRLSKYGVHPKNVRIGTHVAKGYEAGDLYDAWSRYLPPPSPSEESVGEDAPPSVAAVTAVTSATDATTAFGEVVTEAMPALIAVPPNARPEPHRSHCEHGVLAGDRPAPDLNGRRPCAQCDLAVAL